MRADASSTKPLPFYESIPLAFILFVFWIILSGKMDLFHLGAGVVSSLAVGYLTCRLYSVTPYVGPEGRHPFYTMPWIRLVRYVPWLSWQIIVASFQVARIVLSPKMPIAPKLFRFEHPLPHTLAKATLANSITLTPGTVTIDVRGDEYLVHALTAEASEPLQGSEPRDMKSRVGDIFAGAAE